MAKFTVGEIVYLKSGGPDMTIQAVFSPETEGMLEHVQYESLTHKYPNSTVFYTCSWFDNKKHSEAVFVEEAIDKK